MCWMRTVLPCSRYDFAPSSTDILMNGSSSVGTLAGSWKEDSRTVGLLDEAAGKLISPTILKYFLPTENTSRPFSSRISIPKLTNSPPYLAPLDESCLQRRGEAHEPGISGMPTGVSTRRSSPLCKMKAHIGLVGP